MSAFLPAARRSANFWSMRLGMAREDGHRTPNVQHRTSNQSPIDWMLDVRCWMLDALAMTGASKPPTLTINEIYESIQGESTWAGLRCVFVRLTFCDLRCNYCDTEYAFYEGKKRRLPEIIEEVLAFACPLVEITGGCLLYTSPSPRDS